ncbi:molybdopterin-dependent oxidoreductase [Tropicimonas sp. TH_r6]|uniref:molybdopterin-dependent oxidoreductase n=1 Tax=Tropicimonas sp. TH_r6 TaxID=3082085 RepID=UPI00295402A4|nr:molybdopterin-dependent oxidoreductase [Tropicimonas sp. TH_r6]MDV7144001.1 molybdopterin-dependent oxidoreductase [Tropicimonas sp. TH_r6]
MYRIASPLRNKALAACLALTSALSAAVAQELSEPAGDVVLTVSGTIGATNGDGAARFDMDMLQAMPARTLVTTTIWTEGEQTFTGVELHAVLDLLGVENGEITATAINDYAVSIPVSDAVKDGPIVAYARNGEPMSVREKGPLWIIYPYDSSAEYRTETTYARSIWQLDRLTIAD